MKKNFVVSVAAMSLSFSLIACGSSQEAVTTGGSLEEVTENLASTESSSQEASEEMVGLSNPWHDCTEEEAFEYAPDMFSAPEGASNEKWSYMDNTDSTSDISFPLVQLTFDYEGNSFTAREWYGVSEDTDISGLYYEWTATEDVTLANWGYGQMPATTYRYVGDGKYVDLITWRDLESGALYSLSTESSDLDGFDIQAVAEAMYDEAKQSDAEIPDDEDEHVPMDITGCDTFTQIVDKLENGMGYANAVVGDTDVLLVSSYTYDYDGNGKFMAIDADIYYYNEDGVPTYCGYVTSDGTATPLSVTDGVLYVAGHHYVKKYTIVSGILAIDEQAYVEYDSEGNETYYYTSELHDVEGTDENGVVPDNEKFTEFYAEYMNADMVEFNVVSK